MPREFQIVLLGATGVTGLGCAEYLAKNYPDLKWAIAGRSERKLKGIKENLEKLARTSASVGIIVADSNDMESLVSMAKRTTTVISCVGPFIKYGFNLVEACVQEKTHYVDSTGEPNFVLEIVLKHHEKAKKDGTFIIPCTGFDCIPSDLGTYVLAKHMRDAHDADLVSAHLGVDTVKGATSGGTIHSMLEIIEQPFAESRKIFSHHCFNPDGKLLKNAPDTLLSWNAGLERWQSYYFMSAINIRYVLRSAHLLKYSKNFQYSEGISTKNIFTALMIDILFATMGLLLLFPPVRWMVRRAIPQGSGPTREEIEKGFFKMRIIGQGEDKQGRRFTEIVKVVGNSGKLYNHTDPGYGETCKMVVESAVCLTLEREKLGKSVSRFPAVTGGVVTAASGLGDVLAVRLRKFAGMTFEVMKK